MMQHLSLYSIDKKVINNSLRQCNEIISFKSDNKLKTMALAIAKHAKHKEKEKQMLFDAFMYVQFVKISERGWRDVKIWLNTRTAATLENRFEIKMLVVLVCVNLCK